MIRILLVGKRKQPIAWASIYLRNRHKLTRLRMLDGVKRIVKVVYGPINYYDYPWEKRFNVYNAMYRSDPEAWVKFMERRIRKLDRDVVVDDPHYINEVNYLVNNLRFTVVRIDLKNDYKATPGRALLDSEAGTVLLQEYFGHVPAYKVDYSITASDRQGLYIALDDLMLKLKKELEYNIPEEDLVEPPDPSIWEGLPKSWSEVFNEEKISTPNEGTN